MKTSPHPSLPFSLYFDEGAHRYLVDTEKSIEYAAKLLNRKCTLIEKEEKYCEIAARRLSQGVLPLWEQEEN